jgi:hypothetical protein
MSLKGESSLVLGAFAPLLWVCVMCITLGCSATLVGSVHTPACHLLSALLVRRWCFLLEYVPFSPTASAWWSKLPKVQGEEQEPGLQGPHSGLRPASSASVWS